MKLLLLYSSFIAFVLVFISCNKEHSCETCNKQVVPPIAAAGVDQIIYLPKDSILLDGSASTDPDGSLVSVEWKIISGTGTPIIINPKSLRTIVSKLAQGSYVFELTVTDNSGLTARDTVGVIVNTTTNMQIVADAGPDQTITLPLDSTYLDGSGSVPNGFTGSVGATFNWRAIAASPGHVLKPSSLPVNALAKTTSVATALVPGIYLFAFTVTVAGMGSDTDTVQVTVVNDPINRNSVAYHALVWKDPVGTSWLTTYIISPLRPDIFDNAGVNRGVEISLKLNTSSSWTVIPFRTHDPLNSDVVQYVAAVITNPNNPALVGTKADFRIRFP